MRASVTMMVGLAIGIAAGCAELDRPEDVACPPGGSELTWESFGRPFLDTHCQRCHAGEARPRNGAPPEVTFDTLDDAIAWRDRIFARAAAGNTSMPPGPDGPSAEERELLAEWLACAEPSRDE